MKSYLLTLLSLGGSVGLISYGVSSSLTQQSPEPIKQLPAEIQPARQQPVNQAPPAGAGTFPFDPQQHKLMPDINLRCVITHNGQFINVVDFIKEKPLTDDGKFWRLAVGVETWVGTIEERGSGLQTVRLVHATSVPHANAPVSNSFWVTPMNSSWPNASQGYYCTPVEAGLGFFSVTCDVSHEWSRIFGAGTVKFEFRP